MSLAFAIASAPTRVFAETEGDVFAAPISVYWAMPFVLMLLAIALLPLKLPHWWEKNLHKFYISLLLGIPVLLYFGFFLPSGTYHLTHTATDYLSFVILLASLFVISGGVFLSGDIKATPGVNCLFLFLGSILASVMGTTGASMILIRPLLSTNSERKHIVHTVIFFTFLVGNIGGALTPLGDPPLFMGYLFDVPFTWTLRLWPQWLFAVGLVLAIYYVFERVMYSREPAQALVKDEMQVQPLRLLGSMNIVLLLAVVATVALIRTAPWREIVLCALALVSLKTTEKSVREKNGFSYGPIVEVAVLFFGIFLTMIPAIYLLRMRGAELGVTEAWQFFWAAGSLSSFLDNTPTYVVFFNLAQSLGLGNEVVGMTEKVLAAISLGAVFFGANTYIGNAPNFMIKAIAEERKVKMPSFFGYMAYSVGVLIPVFILITFIWFR